MRFFLLTLTILLLVPMIGFAQGTAEPKPPKTLADMVAKGAQIFYLGNYEGMNGWALIRQGKPEFFYENKDRTTLVMGLMFNQDGDMITMAQLSALKDRVGDQMFAMTGGIDMGDDAGDDMTATTNDTAPFAAEAAPIASAPVTAAAATTPAAETPAMVDAPSPVVAPVPAPAPVVNNRPLTQAEKMYVDLISANWITMNPDGKYDIFAFIDPDCPHCRAFIKDVQPYLIPEGFRVRIIPVGMAAPSLKRAAMLLAISDPVEKLIEYAGGDPAALEAPESINTVAVETNVAKMYQYNLDVTPVIVYKTGKGEIRMVRGRPSDYSSLINDIIHN